MSLVISSNVLRLLIMSKFGGTYLDMDVLIIRVGFIYGGFSAPTHLLHLDNYYSLNFEYKV